MGDIKVLRVVAWGLLCVGGGAIAMDDSMAEAQVADIEREILRACRDAHPGELGSTQAGELWLRAAEIAGDTVHYALGGQKRFYEALERLARRGCISVNRGSGGTFRARITPEGMKELGVGPA